MRTIVKGKNIDVPRPVRQYAERKMRRLERLLDDRSDAVVAAYREGLAHDILAIEAEARADVLREIERLLPIIRELALPSSMASGDDGECFFCGGDANEPEDHAEDCLVTSPAQP